jgi:iron complex transport system substrate-binding protein
MRPGCRPGLLLWLIILGWTSPATCATFIDALGREVRLQQQPQRIVALAPSLTEILFALGIGERLVGATKFSDYPAAARSIPRVGSYVDINVERIISLRPELIIGTVDGNQPEKVALLERAGLPVFIVDPRDIRQVIATVVTLGEVCGVAETSAALAAELSARVDRVVARTAGLPRPLVFLQINAKPIMTANKNSFLHDLVQLAGGSNLAGEETVTYPRISLEEVIRKKPEVIIISSMQRDGNFEAARRQWLRWPVIPAVRDGRVYLVDSDLTDRPSPRVVEGLELLARYLHPQAGWND